MISKIQTSFPQRQTLQVWLVASNQVLAIHFFVSAKKLEAIREDIRSDVDFVLTFEELMGMFQAKEIDFEKLEDSDVLNEGTAAGRGFAVAGGVAKAGGGYDPRP